VYLRCVQAVLEQDAHAQALVMVPEINLTPQLEERFTARFGAGSVVSLHSGMTNPQRLKRPGWQRTQGRRASCWARAWRCLPRCQGWP
jgi:primosomal protein N'